MTALIVAVAVFGVSALLTGALRRYALHRRLLDTPNARSSHTAPTPRGGGLALVFAWVLASSYLLFTGTLAWASVAAACGAGLLVAAVGFWDDHGHVAAPWRFVAHLGAAVGALLLLGGLPPLPLGSVTLETGILGSIAGVLGVAWLLNLYNFMDGIDGIASVEAITVCAGAAAILWTSGEGGLALWCLALAAATAGFLVWNWPPARIFMGDVGSGFLGFVLGVMAVATSHSGEINLWSWLILLGVFVVDATVTLARRVLRRERWWEAHRSHAYQWMARRWQSHRRVTLWVGIVNLCWLFPLAWISAVRPGWGGGLFVVAYGSLAVVALAAGAGRAERRAGLEARGA